MPVHGTRGTTRSEGCLLLYSVVGNSLIFPICLTSQIRSRSPTPGASLSARQEVPEVEAPVHLAPHQAQQGAQEDRVLPQVAAVQVCDGLEGVDATHLQARTPGGKVVLQLSGTEEGRVKHSDAPSSRSRCGASHALLPMYFSRMPAFSFIPQNYGSDALLVASHPLSPPGFLGKWGSFAQQRPLALSGVQRLSAATD